MSHTVTGSVTNSSASQRSLAQRLLSSGKTRLMPHPSSGLSLEDIQVSATDRTNVYVQTATNGLDLGIAQCPHNTCVLLCVSGVLLRHVGSRYAFSSRTVAKTYTEYGRFLRTDTRRAVGPVVRFLISWLYDFVQMLVCVTVYAALYTLL